MGNYSKPSFGRGNKKFGDRREDGDRPLFKAVCGTCSKDCEVPFEPTSGKPVLCSDCFRSSSPRKDFGKPRFERSSGGGDFGPRRERREKPDMSESVMFQVDKLKKQVDSLEQKIDAIAGHLQVKLPRTKATSDELKKLIENVQSEE